MCWGTARPPLSPWRAFGPRVGDVGRWGAEACGEGGPAQGGGGFWVAGDWIGASPLGGGSGEREAILSC